MSTGTFTCDIELEAIWEDEMNLPNLIQTVVVKGRSIQQLTGFAITLL
jgi:hypothetical protein